MTIPHVVKIKPFGEVMSFDCFLFFFAVDVKAAVSHVIDCLDDYLLVDGGHFLLFGGDWHGRRVVLNVDSPLLLI